MKLPISPVNLFLVCIPIFPVIFTKEPSTKKFKGVCSQSVFENGMIGVETESDPSGESSISNIAGEERCHLSQEAMVTETRCDQYCQTEEHSLFGECYRGLCWCRGNGNDFPPSLRDCPEIRTPHHALESGRARRLSIDEVCLPSRINGLLNRRYSI